jgi:hypothetical protein
MPINNKETSRRAARPAKELERTDASRARPKNSIKNEKASLDSARLIEDHAQSAKKAKTDLP